MTFILELIALLRENNTAYKVLESLGGGFSCTFETLQDKEKATPIAEVILRLAETNEKIVRLISDYRY